MCGSCLRAGSSVKGCSGSGEEELIVVRFRTRERVILDEVGGDKGGMREGTTAGCGERSGCGKWGNELCSAGTGGLDRRESSDA